MKKCYFSLLLTSCILFSANSQILIDGNMSDWNSVPVLSEPGVYPYVKTTTDGTSVFYSVSLDASNTFNANSGPGLETYIDADFSSTTGQKSDWLYVSSGNDYFIQGLSIFNYAGTPGANEWNWNWLSFTAENRAFSADVRTLEQKLLITDLTAMPLSANYSIAFGYYYSTNADWSASGYLPQSDANFAQRKSFSIKPRTEVSLSTTADFTSGNAYYHPFMNDANISQYLDFQSGATASDNPKQWASWAINLATPGVYDFKMTSKCSDSGQAQLSLVNMETNAVVKTFTAVWYPVNATMTENAYGTIDLSDVPAGQYMLKLSSTSVWDTYLKVEKITLSRSITSIDDKIELNRDVNIKVSSNMLSVNTSKAADISIYALNGALVSDFRSTSSVNKELGSGLYLVTVRLEGKQFSKKILIIN
jgi:hypothetical protein